MVVGRMMPLTPSPHSAHILLLLKLSFPDYRGKGKSMLYMERGKQINTVSGLILQETPYVWMKYSLNLTTEKHNLNTRGESDF